MLYAGLDLNRKRLDFCLLDQAGRTVETGAAPPDADGLRGLAARLARFAEPVQAAIESMNGARFVHDQLEQAGWEVEIADAVKMKGLAPLACKTDRIDARVLAELPAASSCRRSGFPTRRCAQNESELASGSTSSATAPASSCACTRSCSPTANLARLRSLRRRRPHAARAAGATRALGRHSRSQPAADRRARPADHRLRDRPAPTRRRPPLRAAAHDHARNRLGARLHDRRRDR